MQKIWKIIESDESLIRDFSNKLNIDPIIAKLLINREVLDTDQASRFLKCSLSDLYDPFMLKDMDKAVSRIIKAIKNKEKILIHGDYDVDGITSVALVSKYLKSLKADVLWYIPNRLQEGYGLGESGVKYAKKNKTSLLITVDCGTFAFEAISELNGLGIDTIATDHHHPDEKLPPAYAILNPLREDCNYPYKGLAGVGVGFKLCQALSLKLGTNQDYLFNLLDIVALGTIADVCEMTGENRILVRYGLDILNRFNNIGLKALSQITSLEDKTISSEHISFIFAPRLNASGRLGVADKSLQLLLTEDISEAKKLAEVLDDNNKIRQDIQVKTYKEAISKVEDTVDFSINKVIVVHSPGWHPGVIGIVASKLIEKYYRPTLILCGRGKLLQGSGRSIRGFHLYEAISECRDLLESFGGHEMACGVTLRKDKILDFKIKLNKIANKIISIKDLTPSINIDSRLELSSLNKNIVTQLEDMAPFGPGNPKPVFCSMNLSLKGKPKYLKRNGAKLWVSDGALTCEAIGFGENNVDKISNSKNSLHIAYSPYIDKWWGEENIALKIKDIKLK